MYNVEGVKAIYLKFVFNFNYVYMHSTVYDVEGVEASNNSFNPLKEHDPDHNTSWFELGERAGIEIVDEEEVDTEVQEIEEDKEVECIYNDAKDKHRRMLTGTCIFSVEGIEGTVYGILYFKSYGYMLLNVGCVKGTLYAM